MLGLVVALGVLHAAPAVAQEYPDGGNDRPPVVDDEEPQISPPGGSDEAPEVGGIGGVPSGTGADSLAYTGLAVAALVALGLALIVAGAALRRARADAAQT